MEVVVSYDNPRNVDEWNALCKECGNYLQTTMQADMAKYSGQRVVYFEVIDNQNLIGGGQIVRMAKCKDKNHIAVYFKNIVSVW